MPQSGRRPLQSASHLRSIFFKRPSKKKQKTLNIRCRNLPHQRRCKRTRYSLVCPVTRPRRRLYVSPPRSVAPLPPSPTSLLPLIFHRQALPEPTTTQPGKNSTESCCRASLPLTLIPSHHISISSKKQNASNHFNFFPLRRSIINAVNFRGLQPRGGTSREMHYGEMFH